MEEAGWGHAWVGFLPLRDEGAVKGIHGEGAGAQRGRSPRMGARAPQESGGEAGGLGSGEADDRALQDWAPLC